MVSVNTGKTIFKSLSSALEKKINVNEVKAFSRKYDPKIGEELTHKITGQRFFKGTGVNGRNFSVKDCAREITKDGYRGISNEYFEALKEMKISKKTGPYSGKYIKDDFTGAVYWADKTKNGDIVAKMEDSSIMGRRSIPTSLWEKIQSLFT